MFIIDSFYYYYCCYYYISLLLSQLEFFTVQFFFIILFFFISTGNAITLLIISEFTWVCLTVVYLLCGYLTNSYELFIIFIVLLVFATTDCCIWLYVLIVLHKINTTTLESGEAISFFYRARQKLLINNYIV